MGCRWVINQFRFSKSDFWYNQHRLNQIFQIDLNQQTFSDFWFVQARIQVMPPATPPRQKHRAVMPLGRPSATGMATGKQRGCQARKWVLMGFNGF